MFHKKRIKLHSGIKQGKSIIIRTALIWFVARYAAGMPCSYYLASLDCPEFILTRAI